MGHAQPNSNPSPVIAPPGKIQSSFLLSNNNNGLGTSSSGIGLSSSIYNLPVLGQENTMQPTQRGLKPADSGVLKNISKLNKNPTYFQVGTVGTSSPSPDNLLQAPTHLSSIPPRNGSMLQMKKGSARFLS